MFGIHNLKFMFGILTFIYIWFSSGLHGNPTTNSKALCGRGAA